MASPRALKECFLTPDYMERFSQALGQCHQIKEADGRMRVKESQLAAAMATAFGNYKLADASSEKLITNDSEPFRPVVALQFLAMQRDKESRRPLAELAYRSEVAFYEGKDPGALRDIGDQLAEHPERQEEILRHFESLPDERQSYDDDVAYWVIDPDVLSSITQALEKPSSKER